MVTTIIETIIEMICCIFGGLFSLIGYIFLEFILPVLYILMIPFQFITYIIGLITNNKE